jgi:DNA invertase Pin-like site-specific DNA recombinase
LASPDHHERRARLYCEAKGWDVREVYKLDAVSGNSVIEHAEAKRMMADVKRGKITGLVFSKLARLARNTRELLEFADYFKRHDADLISLNESLDTSSPAGRQRLLDVLAAERDKVSAEREQVYALYMAKGLDKEDFAVRHRLEARGILGNVSTGGAPLSPSRSPTAGAAPRSEGGIECWSPAATVGRA